MNFFRSAIILGFMSLSMMVVGSCSSETTTPAGSTSTAGAGSEPAAKKNSFSGGVYSFPLDAYAETAENIFLTMEAEKALITECMKDFGFDMSYPPVSRERATAQEAEGRSRYYGITDLLAAQKYGYHLNPQLNAPKPQSPSESGSHNFVLAGQKPGQDLSSIPDVATTSPGKHRGKEIPPGGCTGAARTKLYGKATMTAQYKLAKRLQAEAFFSAQGDPRVVSYFADWSRCMRKTGYNYSAPLKVAEEGRFNVGSPTVSATEIQTAVTDVKCKESTGLIAKWHKVWSEYEKKALEKNQLVLKEELEQRKVMLVKAAEVVGAGQ
jgi:hypothetical protein